jgi:hypothetical protein
MLYELELSGCPLFFYWILMQWHYAGGSIVPASHLITFYISAMTQMPAIKYVLVKNNGEISQGGDMAGRDFLKNKL